MRHVNKFVKSVDSIVKGAKNARKGATLPAFLALLNPISHNLKAMLPSLKRSAALTKDMFESALTATEEEMREQKRTGYGSSKCDEAKR